MKIEEIKTKCRGFLLGTAIGDAMGVPFEGLPPIYNVPVEEFWKGFVSMPDNPDLYPGTTSDDTKFTALTMLSFHLNDGFTPEHLASLFCKELEREQTQGWGLSTFHAIARMVHNGIPWDACGSPIGSAGNGAAMRAGPFGLFPWKSKEQMIQATILAAKITHIDPDACAGAVAIAVAHRHLIQCHEFKREDFCNAIVQTVRPLSQKLSNLLERVFDSKDLVIILDELSQVGEGPENTDTGKKGISGYVLPSVAAALSIFMAFPKDPCKALGSAMLAGGDTDTIGSMVGGLIGTLNGYSIWPDHLATNVHEYENLLVVADSFSKTCNERNREMGVK